MIPSLNIDYLKEQTAHKYKNESKIVGIILARYDIPFVQDLINSCYLYWHSNTNTNLDIFWAGYGEYICPEKINKDITILNFQNNSTRVYYDQSAFISIKNKFNNLLKYKYTDKVQLVLLNYREGELKFDESIQIDLEKNWDSNFSNIREIFEFITNECLYYNNVFDLARELRNYSLMNQIKGLQFSDIINTIISAGGLF